MHLALSVGTITVEYRFPKEAPCCPIRDLQYLLLEPGVLTFHGANLDLSHRHLPWWQRTPGINGPGHNFLSIPTTVEGAHMSRYQALSLSLAGLLHSRNLSTFIRKMHVESSQCRGKMSVGSDGRTSRPGPELRGPHHKEKSPLWGRRLEAEAQSLDYYYSDTPFNQISCKTHKNKWSGAH
jgi:hypothetical protein